MGGMFKLCTNLTNLNLSSFDIKNVTDMSDMFYNCNNLINLNISLFDTQNVNNVNGIFFGCQTKIIDSNLSKFKEFNESELIHESNIKKVL